MHIYSSVMFISLKLVLVAFIFCCCRHDYLAVNSLRFAKRQLNRRALFAMQYSATELSNLRSITDKKLGAKLGQDYLLVSTILKPSQSRSEILDCIAQSDLASGSENKKLKVKIVKEQERFDRELKNYKVKIHPDLFLHLHLLYYFNL